MENDFLPNSWSRVYHAYVISGTDIELVWQALLNNLSFEKKANPDAYSREFETFGIDEARDLSGWAIMRPIAGERKVAVIRALSFTTEAQNALLKLFEEPPLDTYFFIILPNNAGILPTLLSRVRVASLKEENEADEKLESFLYASVSLRLAMLSPLIKSKDKKRSRDFLRSLEQKVNGLPNQFNHKFNMAKKILEAEKYVGVRGASLKIILEHLAISL